jgi:pimeloyl-ACP methyl ester carboxylesterase
LLVLDSDPSAADEVPHKTALVTGTVALGAFLTGLLFKRIRRSSLRNPTAPPRALDADLRAMEIMEGQCRYYHRPGDGSPIVFLHSINAAGSSYEMKPLFDALARTTERPLYALEWLGFGRSDRPPVRYTPALYQRQLRRFLSEHVGTPADVVALSLACEFAAGVAAALPFLFRRLVLLAPTGLSIHSERSAFRRAAVGLSSRIGVFEWFFAPLTQRDVLRDFYEQQVFAPATPVPEALVEYAFQTSHVAGAPHAPRFFVQGDLFLHHATRRAYAQLAIPTLLILPTLTRGKIQAFDLAEDVVAQNPSFLRKASIESGLLPQWEQPDATVRIIADFLLTV